MRRRNPSVLGAMLRSALELATNGNPARERGEPEDRFERGAFDGDFDEPGDDDDLDGDDDLDDDVEEAVDEYESFHWGNQPDDIKEVAIPDAPRTLVEIGKLEGVIYRTAKGKRKQESWVHFHDEGEPPTLAYDPKTHQLYILGGKYKITPHGIED